MLRIWHFSHVLPNAQIGKMCRIGQNVNIGINLRGREWVNPQGETKYFNSIQGWRIEVIQDNIATDIPPIPPPSPFEIADDNNGDDSEDDLPF